MDLGLGNNEIALQTAARACFEPVVRPRIPVKVQTNPIGHAAE